MMLRRSSLYFCAVSAVTPRSCRVFAVAAFHWSTVAAGQYFISGIATSCSTVFPPSIDSNRLCVGTIQAPAFFVAATSAGSFDRSAWLTRLKPKNCDSAPGRRESLDVAVHVIDRPLSLLQRVGDADVERDMAREADAEPARRRGHRVVDRRAGCRGGSS